MPATSNDIPKVLSESVIGLVLVWRTMRCLVWTLPGHYAVCVHKCCVHNCCLWTQLLWTQTLSVYTYAVCVNNCCLYTNGVRKEGIEDEGTTASLFPAQSNFSSVFSWPSLLQELTRLATFIYWTCCQFRGQLHRNFTVFLCLAILGAATFSLYISLHRLALLLYWHPQRTSSKCVQRPNVFSVQMCSISKCV